MPLDPIEYLEILSQERYRAIIIHVAPQQSRLLSRYVQTISKKLPGKYLDLLDKFIKSENLKKRIDNFGPEDLRKLLIEESKDSSLLVIDRPDFLLDTWRKREREDFFRMLTDQWDGYRDGMKSIIIICLQTSLEIENLHISDSLGNSRILSLADFNDIL